MKEENYRIGDIPGFQEMQEIHEYMDENLSEDDEFVTKFYRAYADQLPEISEDEETDAWLEFTYDAINENPFTTSAEIIGPAAGAAYFGQLTNGHIGATAGGAGTGYTLAKLGQMGIGVTGSSINHFLED